MIVLPLLLLWAFAQVHDDWACGSARSVNLLHAAECSVDAAPGFAGQDLVSLHASPIVIRPPERTAVRARADALLWGEL